MFRDDGAAVLTDFGIAKDSDSAMDLTQTGTIMGTPKYMSPEQIRGLTVTPTSDLYSLGIMLFQMLTGSVPYTGATMIEVAYKHLNDPIPTLANELEKFQPLIDGLLAKESNQRIQNGNKAQQLLKDIQEATISTTSTTRTAPTTKDDATVILKKDTPSISTHEETALSHNAKSVDQNHSEKNPSNKIRKPVIVTACIALITAAAVILGTRYFKPDSAVTTADVSPSNPPTLFSGQENNPIELAPNEAQESTNNSTDQTSTETPSAADSLFRELQINGLLKSAEIDIQEGRLTSPKDNNALDKYQRVLVIDPSNVIAQQKIDELMP
jgi:serine/threonine protein kinase